MMQGKPVLLACVLSVSLLLAGPVAVRDLLVEGRQIVSDGHTTSIDLPKTLARQRALAQALMA